MFRKLLSLIGIEYNTGPILPTVGESIDSPPLVEDVGVSGMLNLSSAKSLVTASFTSNDGRTKAGRLVDLIFAASLSKEQATAAANAVFESAAGKKKAADLLSKIYANKELKVGEVYDATGPDDETTDLRIVVAVGDSYGIMWTRGKSGRISCKSDSLEGTAKKFFERYPHAEKVADSVAAAL